MNILFIMYDQLRFDYLSCAGHPHLAHAEFRPGGRAGRAVHERLRAIADLRRVPDELLYRALRARAMARQWNGFPLRVGELTLGDHLRKLGMDCWLIGKTHMKADAEGMARLGLEPDSVIGARQAECGFDAWIRDDGLWGEGPDGFYDENARPITNTSRTRGMTARTPGRILPMPGSTTTAVSPAAGCWPTPTGPPISARKTAKRPG